MSVIINFSGRKRLFHVREVFFKTWPKIVMIMLAGVSKLITWLRTHAGGSSKSSPYLGHSPFIIHKDEWITHLSRMAVLLKNVSNSIWHAFSALQNDKSGIVLKSKLKVSRWFSNFSVLNPQVEKPNLLIAYQYSTTWHICSCIIFSLYLHSFHYLFVLSVSALA